MIWFLHKIVYFMTFGAVTLATITMTYTDEYSFETQDGITLAMLYGDQPTYMYPNEFNIDEDWYKLSSGCAVIDNGTYYTYDTDTSGYLFIENEYYIPVESGTYTYSIKVKSDTETSVRLALNVYDSDFNKLSNHQDMIDSGWGWSGSSVNYGARTITTYYNLIHKSFTISENSTIAYIRVGLQNINGSVEYDFKDMQVEKFGYPTEYFDYGEMKTINYLVFQDFTDDYVGITTVNSSFSISDGVLVSNKTNVVTSYHGMGLSSGYDVDDNDNIFYFRYDYQIKTDDVDSIYSYWYDDAPNIHQITLSYSRVVEDTWYYDTHLYTATDKDGSHRPIVYFREYNETDYDVYFDNVMLLHVGDIFGYGNEPTETNMNDWYDLYETAITTNQHDYTYVLNSLELEDIVVMVLSGILWILPVKLMKGLI